MVKEDRIYYSIIKFTKGRLDRPYNEDELRFGPKIMENRGDIYLSYLLEQKKKLNAILNGAISKQNRARYLAIYRSVAAQIQRCEADKEER
jgi:tRNA A22 N-methylase